MCFATYGFFYQPTQQNLSILRWKLVCTVSPLPVQEQGTPVQGCTCWPGLPGSGWILWRFQVTILETKINEIFILSVLIRLQFFWKFTMIHTVACTKFHQGVWNHLRMKKEEGRSILRGVLIHITLQFLHATGTISFNFKSYGRAKGWFQ